MAGYIGQAPANKFLTLDKQTFTTSATDTYSLDRSVSSANEIELFLNNVRQEPIEAYTVNGSNLTLASAITSSDTMYCIYQGKAIGSISPATNSVSNGMLVNSSITLNGSDVSLGGSATVDNTPAFQVKLDGNQSIPDETSTKIQWNNELYDTDSAYDNTTNYRFTVPSGEGGKYWFYSQLQFNTASYLECQIRKNGSEWLKSHEPNLSISNSRSVWAAGVDIASVGDYYEVFAYQDTSGALNLIGNNTRSFFGGYKLIGV